MKVSCGIVPVRKENGVWKFLVLRAFEYWDFPKGGQSNGEEFLETAFRETEEETGIKQKEFFFDWGKDFIETEPYNKNKKKIARYYLARTTKIKVDLPINTAIGKPEHEEYRWITFEESFDLDIHERVKTVLYWAYSKILIG